MSTQQSQKLAPLWWGGSFVCLFVFLRQVLSTQPLLSWSHYVKMCRWTRLTSNSGDLPASAGIEVEVAFIVLRTISSELGWGRQPISLIARDIGCLTLSTLEFIFLICRVDRWD